MPEMKSYATFDLWAADQSPKFKRLILILRKLVKKASPQLTETVKAVDESVRGFESQRKLIVASKKEEAQKALPPGMSIEGKGSGTSSGVGAGAQDAEFDNIVF